MTEPGRRRPQRVRVTRTVPLRGRVVSPARSPDVVSVYDRSLRRAQLRWSLASVLVVVVPLLGLPVLGVVLPGVAALPVLGVPLAWWLLAVLVYPVLWLAGRRHVAGAERSEEDYRELVTDLPDAPAPDPIG
ncbi:hypothetical protein [Aquipuribacter hungaricus]|uniref:DUF485 domain-containing protein n=1 Tax=Aquipuribacter hungaricus TaxID=545624 RepID=A0ABV7WIG7_9MICO